MHDLHPISSMCFSRYSTRIVANVADVDKFARNELATICKTVMSVVKIPTTTAVGF